MIQIPTRRFFVVIHTLENGVDHIITQTKLAKNNGADGIIIIPDYAKGRDKMANIGTQCIYLKILTAQHSDFLIGVNFLKNLMIINPSLLQRCQPNFIQTDSSSAEGFNKDLLSDVKLFCGVAFKYSKNVGLTGESLREHCAHVSAIADVPTTSGNATGQPASLEKVREIRAYLPEGKRLGLASGVTEENISGYLQEGVTDFLVATSLINYVDENGFDILDPAKVKRMAEIVHSFN
jgi:predicted TIM-barrel enzyme